MFHESQLSLRFSSPPSVHPVRSLQVDVYDLLGSSLDACLLNSFFTLDGRNESGAPTVFDCSPFSCFHCHCHCHCRFCSCSSAKL